jgi:hypothetical protein
MTVYYADFDLTTGDNNGTTWANAWRTLQRAHDGTDGTQPIAGDVVLCKGTDTITATVAITIDGSAAGGFIKFIGVAASYTGSDPVVGNTGGTDRAVIDADGGAFPAITFNDSDYMWFENFDAGNTNKGSGNSAFSGITATSSPIIFINCIGHDALKGFDNYSGWLVATYLRCAAYNNASFGIDVRNSSAFFCRAYDNSGDGFHLRGSSVIGCISHDNDLEGYWYEATSLFAFYGNVAYGNTNSAIELDAQVGPGPIIGFRAALNSIGIDTDVGRALLFYYYGDNTTETTGDYDEILNNGAATVTLNGTDTNEGFTDPTNKNFSLKSSGVTYRRTAVAIP